MSEKSTASIFLPLAITLTITSTLSGLGAAIIGDFFSDMKNIQCFLVLKAITGTIASFMLWISYFANKQEEVKKYNRDLGWKR